MSRKKTEQEKRQEQLSAIQDNDIEEWSDAGFDECDHHMAVSQWTSLKPDHWRYKAMFCPECGHSWDAWSSPLVYDWSITLDFSLLGTEGPIGENGPQ